LGHVAFDENFFFLAHLVKAKAPTSNTRPYMSILEKDKGLAFPRKEKKKKEPSYLKAKPKKYQKASVSEEMLQNYAEEACIKHNLDYDHTPSIVYEFLASSSMTLTPDIKSYLMELLVGRPDLVIEKRLEGTDYTLLLNLELKTDSPQSKLGTNQKRYLRIRNHAIARNKLEINEAIKDISDFELDI
tara:strand:- start:19549 stop:20109 length:561 start_codon:yes stop_codon:yes gene_type:complete